MMATQDEEKKAEAPVWRGKLPAKVRFGQRLNKLRTERGYTQMEFAMRANLDRSFISDLERGVKEPTLTTLVAIADTLSLTLGELLDSI